VDKDGERGKTERGKEGKTGKKRERGKRGKTGSGEKRKKGE
jgi:hypothetical protein